jgi:adenylate kinase
MIIVLLGPPGVGKGTQGALLAARLGVPQLATGDVLRAAVREGTPQGLAAKIYMDRGDLVPDDVILGIMKDALSKPAAAKGVVLDGVVRTLPQAEGLARVLGELGRKLDAVLVFNADDDELVRRLGGRTVCESCQTPYTGREPGSRCAKCGGKLARRKDDEPEAIRNRLKIFQEQTAPVLQWYRTHQNGVGRVAHVNALGTVDEVTKRVTEAVGA